MSKLETAAAIPQACAFHQVPGASDDTYSVPNPSPELVEFLIANAAHGAVCSISDIGLAPNADAIRTRAEDVAGERASAAFNAVVARHSVGAGPDTSWADVAAIERAITLRAFHEGKRHSPSDEADAALLAAIRMMVAKGSLSTDTGGDNNAATATPPMARSTTNDKGAWPESSEWSKQSDSRTPYRQGNEVSLDTVHADVWHLINLLEVTVDILREMPYVRNGERDVDLDRVNSLARTARDRARDIELTIDNNYLAIQGLPAAKDAA